MLCIAAHVSMRPPTPAVSPTVEAHLQQLKDKAGEILGTDPELRNLGCVEACIDWLHLKKTQLESELATARLSTQILRGKLETSDRDGQILLKEMRESQAAKDTMRSAIHVFMIESEGKISIESEIINSCRFLFREVLANTRPTPFPSPNPVTGGTSEEVEHNLLHEAYSALEEADVQMDCHIWGYQYSKARNIVKDAMRSLKAYEAAQHPTPKKEKEV